jgi:hypothetical protein
VAIVFRWLSRVDPLLEEDQARWVIETFAWLLRSDIGYDEWVERADLVLPTSEFFPVDAAAPDLPAELFELVREYAGMEDWPCRLVPHDEPAAVGELMPGVPVQHGQRTSVAGTFGVVEEAGEQIAEITYSRSSERDHEGFIATVSHELSHYLIHTFPSAPPGGWDAEEPATDICSVYLGFGVFACNTSFRFKQFNDGVMAGWQSKRQGYLEQPVLAFALAVYLRITGNDADAALKHLSVGPRAFLKRALADVDRNWKYDIQSLMAVKKAQDHACGGQTPAD